MRPLALITGASRGLGAAIARQLAPTHDLLLGARSATALEPILAELPGARGWPVELTDDDALARATATIDRLDVLVQNAGIALRGQIAETSAAAWRSILGTNVVAVAELTRLLLPALRAANGHVVLINSGAGRNVRADWGAYGASKFALRGFADGLRQEEPLLRVTSIFPGRIDTDMQREIIAYEGRAYDPTQFLTEDSVAATVGHAVSATPDAHPVDIVLRPRVIPPAS